jgi:signal transduction histidine kinase
LAEPARVSSADSSVRRIRWHLTAWYACTFIAILLLLGGGLFAVTRRQLSKQLDESLDGATLELARAAMDPALSEAGDSALVEEVNDLRIPQRTLYLLDSAANPVSPTIADRWIRQAALNALRHGKAAARYETTDDRTLRIVARRFHAANGRLLVAGAIADQYELEDRYTDLIGAFSLAALSAVVLVAIGGSILTRKSMQPVQATIENMRRFMADAAHELKTPVAILRANAEVALQRSRDPDDYRTALTGVERESNRLGHIIEHMLMLSRADSGARTPARNPFYLDDVVADCVENLKAVATSRSVTLKVSDFDEASVVGDQALVREMVMIVLDNAIKYTQSGGIVDVAVSTAHGHPTVTVADTGIGIDPIDLPRVFDRFYRVRSNGSAPEGAGLGLAIARWIADQHAAEIEITSQLGIGTVVRILFPQSRTAATDGSHSV